MRKGKGWKQKRAGGEERGSEIRFVGDVDGKGGPRHRPHFRQTSTMPSLSGPSWGLSNTKKTLTPLQLELGSLSQPCIGVKPGHGDRQGDCGTV